MLVKMLKIMDDPLTYYNLYHKLCSFIYVASCKVVLADFNETAKFNLTDHC